VLIKLAWRNLWRNRRRTLITVSSVGLGVWLATTFIGMAQHSYGSMIDGSAKMGFGHVTIQPRGYADAPSIAKRVTNALAVRDAARALPEVGGAVIRIAGQAMFATANRSVGGAFLAVDPADEHPENDLFLKSIVEGAMFESSTGRGIVLGRTMSDRLGATLGKKIVYTTVDDRGEILSEVARVVGIYDTGIRDVDASTALLPIDTARRVLGYGPDAATYVSIYLDDRRAADRVRDRLAAAVEGAEVLAWHQSQPELSGMIALDRATNSLFQWLLGLLIAAGVLNTMLMSVLERKRELGIMIAVGMTPARLSLMVVIEAMFVAVVGSGLGALATIPWYWFMSTKGIDFAALYGQEMDVSGIPIETVIRLAIYPETVALILSGVFGLSLLAGLYPAYRAGREIPVQSIKAI